MPASNLQTVTVAGRVIHSDGSAATRSLVFLSWENSSYKPVVRPVNPDGHGGFHARLRLDAATDTKLALSAVEPRVGVCVELFKPGKWRALTGETLTLRPGGTVVGRVVRLNGKPAAGLRLCVQTVSSALMPMWVSPFPEGLQLLPGQVSSSLYQARTNGAGRFVFRGLPEVGFVRFHLSGGFRLPPGSAPPVVLQRGRTADAGILVAVKPGAISVKFTNSLTGKPAAEVSIDVKQVAHAERLRIPISARDGCDFEDIHDGFTDEHGEWHEGGLLPGKYLLESEGASQPVEVAEGVEHPTIRLTTRSGDAQVQVVDSNDRPVFGASIELSGSDGKHTFFTSSSPRGSVEGLTTNSFGFATIFGFPWRDSHVTVEAIRNDAAASWSGPASALPGGLKLTLKPHALVTVTGRLVDSHGAPCARDKAYLVHWHGGAPKFEFRDLLSPVLIGKDSRFKLVGLPRGVPFSLVGDARPDPPARREGAPFESPRFVTATTGNLQDLGDISVLPDSSQARSEEYYGLGPAAQLSLIALQPAPEEAEQEAAKRAESEYGQAMNRCDFNTMWRLAHQLGGESISLQDFMISTEMRGRPASGDPVRTLPFIPRHAMERLDLYSRENEGPTFQQLALGPVIAEFNAHTQWLVRARRVGDHVLPVTILAKEGSEWKVVHIPAMFQPDSINAAIDSAANSDDIPVADFNIPLPVAHDSQAAGAAIESFLAAWRDADGTTMLRAASPLAAFYAPNVAAMQGLLRNLPDGGACPASGGTDMNLRPLTGLTEWDASWLTLYSREEMQPGGKTWSDNTPHVRRPGFPERYVERGDIALFRYQGATGEYIAIAVKDNGVWGVLEPALPIFTPASTRETAQAR